MKNIFLIFIAFVICVSIQAQHSFPKSVKEDRDKIMSEAYWQIWNPQVQAQIDRDIEKNRKADGEVTLADVAPNTEVRVEQISHDFKFGAHIFNFNQLGTPEYNRRYRELYGTFFNSATIAFYWKAFEREPGTPRFMGEYRDTEEYWNTVEQPEKEPHWRRPATDPVVEFCESKGIRMHGHPIIWGSTGSQHPQWVFDKFCPVDEKEKIEQAGGMQEVLKLTPAEIEKLLPIYVEELKRLFDKRVEELAKHYGGRIHSWDIVNESVKDYFGNSVTGDAVCSSKNGILLPGDYTYRAFKLAEKHFPKTVQFNINEALYSFQPSDESEVAKERIDKYLLQIQDLLSHGCRIDIVGSQRHIFRAEEAEAIAAGKLLRTPQRQIEMLETLVKAERPIHLSEITIPSPTDDARGHAIQAIIARDFYRLWFSAKPVMGITWWNVVDYCGTSRESAPTGLFTRSMEPKPSFHALNQLINHEWKTNLILKVGKDGKVNFRGFKGNYRIVWKDNSGNMQTKEYYLK